MEDWCPYCEIDWMADCPNAPDWLEYRCQECGYIVGEHMYTGDKLIIRESNLEG